jgi:hypothetical protein
MMRDQNKRDDAAFARAHKEALRLYLSGIADILGNAGISGAQLAEIMPKFTAATIDFVGRFNAAEDTLWETMLLEMSLPPVK